MDVQVLRSILDKWLSNTAMEEVIRDIIQAERSGEFKPVEQVGGDSVGAAMKNAQEYARVRSASSPQPTGSWEKRVTDEVRRWGSWAHSMPYMVSHGSLPMSVYQVNYDPPHIVTARLIVDSFNNGIPLENRSKDEVEAYEQALHILSKQMKDGDEEAEALLLGKKPKPVESK